MLILNLQGEKSMYLYKPEHQKIRQFLKLLNFLEMSCLLHPLYLSFTSHFSYILFPKVTPLKDKKKKEQLITFALFREIILLLDWHPTKLCPLQLRVFLSYFDMNISLQNIFKQIEIIGSVGEHGESKFEYCGNVLMHQFLRGKMWCIQYQTVIFL